MKFELDFYLEVHLYYRAKIFSKCKKLYTDKILYNKLAKLCFKEKQSIYVFSLFLAKRFNLGIWIQSLLFSTRICSYLDANSLPSFQAD